METRSNLNLNIFKIQQLELVKFRRSTKYIAQNQRVDCQAFKLTVDQEGPLFYKGDFNSFSVLIPVIRQVRYPSGLFTYLEYYNVKSKKT